MGSWLLRTKWLALVVSIPLFLAVAVAGASAEISLALTYPNEGQILYAGPGVPRYVIPVTGRVSLPQGDPSTVQLSVDVFQGGKKLSGFTARPEATGDFEFLVTVNADTPFMGIPPERGYCRECHDEVGLAALSGGDNLLVVTATGPDGKQSIVQRRIVVDRSGVARLLARLEPSGAQLPDTSGLPVVAATEFPVTASPSTDHQTREFSGVTDATGSAALSVESMASMPLHYRVYVPRTVHDGVLVESTQVVSVDVPAGAAEAGSVVIPVTVRSGQIAGTIDLPGTAGAPTVVYAVAQPSGHVYTTTTRSSDNRFIFSNLPIGRYVVGSADTQGGAVVTSRVQAVDLVSSPDSQVALAGNVTPPTLHGVVHGAAGRPLAFAWVTDRSTGRAVRVDPASGAFVLPVDRGGGHTVDVVAPSHWSQTLVLQAGAGAPEPIELKARPDGRQIPLPGGGSLQVPTESTATQDGDALTLYSGWFWGQTATEPYTLTVPGATVAVEAGSDVAIELRSQGTPWLYVRNGSARVSLDGRPGLVLVGAGQMLALTTTTALAPAPVAIDPIALALLHSGESSPLDFRLEPSVAAAAQTALARLGISVAQVVTLAAYTLAPAILLISLLMLIIWRVRRRSNRLRLAAESANGR